MDVQRIEDKLDKVVGGAIEIQMELGGVKFQSMMELFEFSKLMAISGAAVPYHLRGNAGSCLAICTKALRFGFDPFSLAEHSFSMKKSTKTDNGAWEDVETIAFDSYVIRAIINAHAPVEGGITYSYEGEGPERICIAAAKRTDNGQVIIHRSAKLGDKLAGMRKNDKGEIKGSPLWSGPKSDVQMAYDTGRDLCRIHFPEILMGWYDKDEFDEQASRAVQAKDVTPKPAIGDRLKGNKGRGFDAKHIETQTDQTIKDSAGSQSSQGAAEGKAGASSISDAPADAPGSTEKAKEGDPRKEATEGAQDGKSPSTEPEPSEEAEFGPPEAMEQGRELRRKNLPCRVPEDWVAAKRTDLIEALKEGYDDEEAEIKVRGKKK